jgi:hypothetical protein
MIPVPTRKVSIRLTTTYAGFSNESTLLENLYKRGLAGEEIAPALYRQDGLLMFWSHEPVAPWQDQRWLEQMRAQSSRESAFRRLIRNEWTSSESQFINAEMFDACIDPEARPVLADRSLQVYAGLDASIRHDTTALVAVTYDAVCAQPREG